MPAKFAVMNDQSGDEKEVTLKEFADLQLRGYRIVDVGAYNQAVADDAAPAPESPAPAKSAAPSHTEKRTP